MLRLADAVYASCLRPQVYFLSDPTQKVGHKVDLMPGVTVGEGLDCDLRRGRHEMRRRVASLTLLATVAVHPTTHITMQQCQSRIRMKHKARAKPGCSCSSSSNASAHLMATEQSHLESRMLPLPRCKFRLAALSTGKSSCPPFVKF